MNRLLASSRLFSPLALLIGTSSLLAGCNVPINRNQEFDTALAKVTRIGTIYAPMGGQQIGANLVANSGFTYTDPYGNSVGPGGNPNNTTIVAPTSNAPTSTYVSSYANPWPTNFIQNDMYMPAKWDLFFTPNMPCYQSTTPSTATPPYPLAPSTQYSQVSLVPGVGMQHWYNYFTNPQAPSPTPIQFTCYINTAANPQISPTGILPRFALDDALPASVQVAALSQINAQAADTHLHLYATDLSIVSTATATSVDPSGMSAIFPYPTGPNGGTIPAGTYVTTITTDTPGQQETTNSFEPIVVGHDNKTYPGAFGVAYVSILSREVDTYGEDQYGDGSCETDETEVSNTGFSGPLVTSVTQNKLLGVPRGPIAVGANPTVVLPINYVFDDNVQYGGRCTTYEITNGGPQSAFVVNTGSASVSVVQIGGETFPSGTISVGQQPVAAVVGPNNLVYVANYGSGTISEVDPVNLIQTRTLPVMASPTSLNFDASGVLWVGGQGYLDSVNLSTWSIASSTPVDGTVSQMGYSKQQNTLVQVVLQNGTPSSPSSGRTMSAHVSYSSPQSSYSTVMLTNAGTGASSGPAIAAQSNAVYVQSPIAGSLAYPAQTAFVPASLSGSGLSSPGISSSSGDLVAVANGNVFTISALPSGEAMMSGTLPYPIRGVSIGGNTVYFTMTESNSVVTVPMKF